MNDYDRAVLAAWHDFGCQMWRGAKIGISLAFILIPLIMLIEWLTR